MSENIGAPPAGARTVDAEIAASNPALAKGVKKRSRGILSVRTLAILAVLYTVYLTQDILMPIVVAVMLYLVLLPILRLLTRLHVPQFIGAGLITLSLLATIGLGAFTLAGPVADWISRAPTALGQIELSLAGLKKPVDEVKKASEKVEKLTQLDGNEMKPQSVVVQSEGVMERLFSGLRAVGVQLFMILILLLFLLSSGEMFKEKLVRVMPRLTDKKRAVTFMRDIESEISNYLLTVTLINIGLGIIIGLGMWAIGMANAPLWGVMAAILNYIPFVGGIVGTAVLFAAASLTLPNFGDALIATGGYIGVHVIESELATPAILGRRLAMNAVVIAVALIIGGWMWGVMGALLAVPILVFCKVLCDNIDELNAVGEFISRREIRHEAPTVEASAAAAK